jgi:hypothetical protein
VVGVNVGVDVGEFGLEAAFTHLSSNIETHAPKSKRPPIVNLHLKPHLGELYP